MACFLVPAAEAVITTVVAASLKKKEQSQPASDEGALQETTKIRFSAKLGWLNRLLWGGSILLAFEHVWHGEVVPWFPFLTAMSDPEEAAEMFHEMATVGVCMAILVTLVWVGMVVASSLIEKRVCRDASEAKGDAQA